MVSTGPVQSLQLGVEILAALLERTVLEVVLEVVGEVHNLALEYLHLVRQLVELDHILGYYLLLKVQICDVPGRPHPNPIILLLNYVIDSLDSHEEAEHRVVIDQALLVKYDL